MFLCTNGETWEPVPIPDYIRNSLPPETDNSQRNWDQLARELVADILGQGYSGYQTFRDGWIFQEVIDNARGLNGWTPVAADI
jgi:hypothetical protein